MTTYCFHWFAHVPVGISVMTDACVLLFLARGWAFMCLGTFHCSQAILHVIPCHMSSSPQTQNLHLFLKKSFQQQGHQKYGQPVTL
mmetsp:Transcript_16937/g.57873  ORF Transcript_16937/g.57873 Transcript_16937/m.57873 type:complete len:86 (-) Transcript_16937:1440-1697(-)